MDRVDEGLGFYETAFKMAPAESRYLISLLRAYADIKKWDQAIRTCREAYMRAPDDINFGLNFAWLLATVPEDQLRNGSRALEISIKIAQLTKYRNVRVMDCLAAAYAEVGNFNTAIRILDRLIPYAKDRENLKLVKQLEERLANYKKRKPWRS